MVLGLLCVDWESGYKGLFLYFFYCVLSCALMRLYFFFLLLFIPFIFQSAMDVVAFFFFSPFFVLRESYCN